SSSFNVVVDSLSFTTQPSNVASGSSFSPTVVVTILLPGGGGTDTNATGTVALAISNCGASLTGTTSRILSSGVATFTGLGATGAGTSCTLTASISGGTSATNATSSGFNVTTGGGGGGGSPVLTSVNPNSG